MAPVMVWVVDTGMPAAEVKNSVAAAADSAAMPPTGWSRVIFEPIVFTMRQPPVRVPRPMAVWAASTTQSGTSAPGRQVPAGDEQGEDDAHRLLGVVGAVAEAEGRGRDELAPSEAPVEPLDVPHPVEHPHDHAP